MGKLDGKIALVTGGNSGIGLATAKQFVHEGAYVFITGRRGAELAAAVKEIGRNVTGVQGDVSNVADVERLFAQIKQEKGKLDIVFANAGVVRYAALGAISEEFFDSIFDTNVNSAGTWIWWPTCVASSFCFQHWTSYANCPPKHCPQHLESCDSSILPGLMPTRFVMRLFFARPMIDRVHPRVLAVRPRAKGALPLPSHPVEP
jgi:NAD(P)-dependent dehydrogenase (short-subunit alcohol dehydrogenase family)